MAILSVGAIGYINGTGVRVRQTPVNGSVLYTATINDELQCQATQYGSDGYTWLRVLNTTDNTKATGWVREDLVRAGGYNGGNTGTAADGVIDGSGVRVRTGPGTSYGTLTFVSTNDRVTYYVGSEVYANGYTWVRCTSALWLSNGYIASEYVKPYTGGGTNPGGGIGGEANPPPNMPYINANMVPVKAHSSSSSTTLAYLNQNAPVVVTSSIGSWYGIFYNEGATPLNGFVQSTYLSFPVSGFPQTTGNYHCAACSYQGKLGKTLKRLSYYQYNTCSRHSNCKVVTPRLPFRLVAVSA